MAENADFIIIGGGSAGCVLANRLSANPSTRVILLEAGGRDSSFMYRMPAGFFALMKSGQGNWRYESVPQTGLNGRSMYFPRGKVLGGSSSINGLVASRGAPADYDHWAQLGNLGWSYDDCLPYFKRLENFDGDSNDTRGKAGPIAITTTPHDSMNPLAKAWLDAAQLAGHPFNPDPNGRDTFGIAHMQGTYCNGVRQSASTCYLAPIRNRGNLRVITGALVERIDFEGKRAVGVTYSRDGQSHSLGATHEIILSGGAINSPQILQLSGIGDPDDLAQARIPLRHALPAVGKGLKDHLSISVKQPITERLSLLGQLSPWAMVSGLTRYLLTKSGPTSVSALEAWAHLKSSPEKEWADLQFYAVPLVYNDHGRDIIKQEGFMTVVCGLRPRSSGTVKAVSANPAQSPAIDPNYFSDPEDIAVLRSGIRLARAIHAQAPFDTLRSDELAPGVAQDSDEQLDRFIVETAMSLYHPIGTCRMGQGDQAVVDTHLRVHGLDGLRVVDASVMPDIISGNTNLPVMMIAEKASDEMLGAYSKGKA